MMISKILNNNTAVVLGKDKDEIIVIGKGICFKKRPGDFVLEKDVEKQYVLSTKDLNKKFQQLLTQIPDEFVHTADDIIDHAKKTLGRELGDNIYISLTDHLAMAIKRFQEGISVANPMARDIKRFYRQEYEIGLYALDVIERRHGLRLPEDEAGFVALHVLNADMNMDSRVVDKSIHVIQEILEIIKESFSLTVSEDSVFFDRLITHLRYFSYRLYAGIEYEGDGMAELLVVVQRKHPAVYACVEKIAVFIEEKYASRVTEDEMLYLTIHIARILEVASKEQEGTHGG